MKSFEINGRKIGENFSPYIIAEISANHNGDINKAIDLIHSAKECGADAVKIQTYTADTMTLPINSGDFVIKGGLWDGQSLYDLYQSAHTPWEWHERLFQEAKKAEITLFSSPFDETAVDLLANLNAPAYKVASFEFLDHPLIKYIASKNKPMILSTGMANLDEIKETYQLLNDSNANFALLHCVSGYPTPTSQLNTKVVKTLKNNFDCLIGLSDHSLSDTAAITAVSQGACIIEKHFIDSRQNKGPDSDFSLEPSELKRLCSISKEAWESLGTGKLDLQKAEKSNVQFRRSIYFSKSLKKGEKITADNIKRIRPGKGLAPKHFESLLGRTVSQDIEMGTPTSWSLLADQ